MTNNIIGTHGSFSRESDGRLSGTVITIHPPRRDGKYPVAYAFGTSGRRFSKLYTRDQCEAAIASVSPANAQT